MLQGELSFSALGGTLDGLHCQSHGVDEEVV